MYHPRLSKTSLRYLRARCGVGFGQVSGNPGFVAISVIRPRFACKARSNPVSKLIQSTAPGHFGYGLSAITYLLSARFALSCAVKKCEFCHFPRVSMVLSKEACCFRCSHYQKDEQTRDVAVGDPRRGTPPSLRSGAARN